MSEKLLVNDFKWVKDISEFIENFIKSFNDESDVCEKDYDKIRNHHILNNMLNNVIRVVCK